MTARTAIPAMTNERLHARLERIGAGWQGLGCAVECGSWLGASACALARGLVRAGYDRLLHLYDHWMANESEVRKAARFGVTIEVGENLTRRCRDTVAAVYPDVVTHHVRLRMATWSGQPIEVFILDAAKRNPDFAHVMDTFGPHIVPGGVVGLLDCHYWEKLPRTVQGPYRCQEEWAADYAGHLADMGRFDGSTDHFYRVRRPL